jgi:hypothetical protein
MANPSETNRVNETAGLTDRGVAGYIPIRALLMTSVAFMERVCY